MQMIATDTQITHWQRAWLYLLCGAVLAFLVVPCLLVIPMSLSADSFLHFPPRELSLRWYRSFLGSEDWMHGARISIEVAFATVVLATSLGTAGAYAIRQLDGRLAMAIRTIYMLPMIAPVILIAVGVFFVYARLGLNNSVEGLVLAHTLLALPYVVITVGSGLETYDMSQERVARSLGASRLKAFVQVTLPQIAPSIYSSLLFSFMTSFDETVIVLFVSGGDTSTLTRLMFENIRDQQDPTIAAISTLLLVVSTAALIVAQRLARRKVGE
ncbi:ABC transporter permease [Paraburkholderia phosphatilytica]|uniref:ABC transporter permease n=1 Tax=Paraburkholderia phosphatilytica TaxID=2282883 RepID=UPI001F0B72A1|nr:ABC transporter permease [Paraburkholderia phosphatilytica]